MTIIEHVCSVNCSLYIIKACVVLILGGQIVQNEAEFCPSFIRGEYCGIDVGGILEMQWGGNTASWDYC